MNNSTLLAEVLILTEPFRNERYLNQSYDQDTRAISLTELFHFVLNDMSIDDLEQFNLLIIQMYFLLIMIIIKY